ncbi:MAG: UDP-N-acetylmuramate--L-alanine ligase, partial [Clostridia bacterium]|nr:UDP-N-acetylmuramate--L-alanine ligase [Clostridia bacterium]
MKNISLFELPENAKIHMVGIGGISMSALAFMLRHFGYTVSGSDRTETKITEHLSKEGFKITIGHSADAVSDP